MSFDLVSHLGAMHRDVRNLQKDGKPAKAVIASRLYDTTPEDLWDALTRPERIRRWFAPVSGDLVLGGRYQVEGNAGGTVLECEPNRKLALTWEFGGIPSWVTVTLTPKDQATMLELEHVAHLSSHWDQYGPGAVGLGWDLSFMGLSRHLAEPEAAVAAEAVEGWSQSQQALDMMAQTSRAWGEAAIAAGDERGHAERAAEATRRFYCGEPPLED